MPAIRATPILVQPRSELDVRETLPNRRFADILSQIEAAPAGRFFAAAVRDMDERLRLPISDPTPQAGASDAPPTVSAESRARNSLLFAQNDAGAAEDPPSESEVWEKLQGRDHPVDVFSEQEAEKTYAQGAYYKKIPARSLPPSITSVQGPPAARPRAPWSAKATADLAELAKMPPTPSRVPTTGSQR